MTLHWQRLTHMLGRARHCSKHCTMFNTPAIGAVEQNLLLRVACSCRVYIHSMQQQG